MCCVCVVYMMDVFFFFNDTATTEIYTLSLHDALPISLLHVLDLDVLAPHRVAHDLLPLAGPLAQGHLPGHARLLGQDRKSTRLNSSHANISYAVFCLKKKNTN